MNGMIFVFLGAAALGVAYLLYAYAPAQRRKRRAANKPDTAFMYPISPGEDRKKGGDAAAPPDMTGNGADGGGGDGGGD
ncbi:MAG: hypothetical protein AB7O04_09190 [Hyphomonadaceae bacterium]